MVNVTVYFKLKDLKRKKENMREKIIKILNVLVNILCMLTLAAQITELTAHKNFAADIIYRLWIDTTVIMLYLKSDSNC